MPHRDPETGQFLPGNGDWDDIEVVTFLADVGIQAADLAGTTGFAGETNEFEGVQVIDYDDVVDRNEELQLLSAAHSLTAFANSTETADGTIAMSAAVSASPSLTNVERVFTSTSTTSPSGDDVVGTGQTDDTIDLVGRVLVAMGGAPFSDGTTGVGGGGSAGEDSYVTTSFPGEYGRFHPRDELFVNGRIKTWNIDDAAVHGYIRGQHVYGVVSE